MLRFHTAGESHGQGLVALVQGLPAGIEVDLKVDGYPVLTDQEDADFVQTLIDQRNAARKSKNFIEADRIRDKLAAMGVVFKDSKDSTTWEVKR